MKIVKFENGKYGIQSNTTIVALFLGKYYLDLVSERIHTWKKGDKYFQDCQADWKTVSRKWEELTAKTPVKF